MSLKLSRKEWEAAEGIQEIRDNERYLNDQCQALRAERDALQAQVEVLRKALQPFSDAAGVYFAKNYNKIDCIDDHYGTITAGSLFDARAALSPIKASDADRREVKT